MRSDSRAIDCVASPAARPAASMARRGLSSASSTTTAALGRARPEFEPLVRHGEMELRLDRHPPEIEARRQRRDAAGTRDPHRSEPHHSRLELPAPMRREARADLGRAPPRGRRKHSSRRFQLLPLSGGDDVRERVRIALCEFDAGNSSNCRRRRLDQPGDAPAGRGEIEPSADPPREPRSLSTATARRRAAPRASRSRRCAERRAAGDRAAESPHRHVVEVEPAAGEPELGRQALGGKRVGEAEPPGADMHLGRRRRDRRRAEGASDQYCSRTRGRRGPSASPARSASRKRSKAMSPVSAGDGGASAAAGPSAASSARRRRPPTPKRLGLEAPRRQALRWP